MAFQCGKVTDYEKVKFKVKRKSKGASSFRSAFFCGIYMQNQFEYKVCQTTCPYCGVGCGVDVTVENGVLTKVAGSVKHPANQGKLCVKGSNLAETTGLENRLLAPEVDGNKVTWDEASQLVADKFNYYIDKYGPDSVAFYVSGQILTEDYYVANKLMKGFIGSANIDTNSRLCMSSAVAGYKRAFGADIVPCSYKDLNHTDLLVLIGSNAAWTHPILFQKMEAAKQQNPKLKVVVIDPRKTATAELADIFLPIKPGTDVALFNGLLNYLINEQKINEEYIKLYCEGWQQTRQSVIHWGLKLTASYCGVDISELEAFYSLFANSHSVISFYSQGVNQSSQGVDKCNAIINCHLATGKIGKLGSGPFSITGQPNAMGGREVGGLANMLAAHMNIEDPNHRDIVQAFWQSPNMPTQAGSKAIDMFNKLESGEIKAIWIMATNPMVSLPNRNQVAKALEKCPFVVVSDCMEMNDTMLHANVKLPATTWSEKDGTVTNSERRISRQRGVVPPPGEAKHDWQIISAVANKMGFDEAFDYQAPYEIFREHAGLSGFKNNCDGYPIRDFDISAFSSINETQYNQLKPVQWPVNETYPNGCEQMFSDGRYFTPSAKAQFITVQPALPKQLTNDAYPFVLNSGRIRDHWHTMTRTGKSASLAKHSKEPYLAINQQDANNLLLQEGDFALINSLFGQVVLPIQIDNGCRAGSVFAPIHWNQMTAPTANIAKCFSSAVDPISGQPESKFVPVAITPYLLNQFQQVFTREEIPMQSDYWVKNKTQQGYEYSAATLDDIEQPITWGKALLSESIDTNQGVWYQFDCGEKAMRTLIYIDEQRVQFVAFIAGKRPEVSSDWIDQLMSEPDISLEQINQLLAIKVDPLFANGKIICSCFKVGEKQIMKVVQEQGDDTVEKLGKRLKCGTNCGSCKSELSAMLKQHQANSQGLIALSEV